MLCLVPPSIVPFQFESSPMNAGSFTSLQCTVSTGDLPVKISWDYPNMGRDDSVTILNVGKRVSMLTVSEVQAHHAGNYTCFAENKALSVAYTVLLLVNGSSPSLPVVPCCPCQ